jgi:hypothetical protein
MFAKWRAAGARRDAPRAAGPARLAADEGVLELYDPETDQVERVELRAMQPGEIWLIGGGSACQICVDAGQAPGGRVDWEADARGAGAAAPAGALVETPPAEGAQEMAALILGHDGPRIEARRDALYYEGRRVLAHRLFDGDHLYLDRFVLYYHNFFRQRALAEGSIEEDA